MEGYTLKQLKGFKFKVIKDMFDKAFKSVNTFVDYKTELVEDDDQEEAEMKRLIKVVLMKRKEDLETLWKLVKAKHGSTRPEDGYERVVHFLRLQSMHIFMLVEKRYPLTPATITEMLNKKLQTDHLNEIVNAAGTKLQLLTELELLMDKD
ncbi:hypothetical protein Tco_0396579 [Tanacetum coccineum]